MLKSVVYVLPETPSNSSDPLNSDTSSQQRDIPNYPKRIDFCTKRLAPQIISLIFFAVFCVLILAPRRQHFLYGLTDEKIRDFNEIFFNLNFTENDTEKRLEEWARDLPSGNTILWQQWHSQRNFALRENRLFHKTQIVYLRNPVIQIIDSAVTKILDDQSLTVSQKHHQLSLIIDEAKLKSPFSLRELESTYLIDFDKLLCSFSQMRQNCDYKIFSRPGRP